MIRILLEKNKYLILFFAASPILSSPQDKAILKQFI